MTTPTLTLTEFLLARIDHDEAAARVIANLYPNDPGPSYLCPNGDLIEVTTGYARVLRDCEAKRAIVEEHAAVEDRTIYVTGGTVCAKCVEFHADMDCQHDAFPCATIRALASVYANEPGYRDEWAV